MYLNKLRIGLRLRLGFGLVLALLIAVVVGDTVRSAQNRTHLFEGLAAVSAKVRLTTTMKSEQLEGVISIRSISLQAEVSAMSAEEEKLKLHRQRFSEARDQLMAMGITETEKTIFATIARLDKDLERPTKEAIAQALAFDSEGVARILATRIDPVYQQVLAEINKLVELQQVVEQDFIQHATEAAERLSYWLMLSAAVAVVVGGVLAWAITRSITQPLDNAVQVARRVADGDLSTDISVDSTDETGELMRALKDMNASLLKTVQQVRSGTDSMASASSQIAAGNQDLSSRTELQASSLQETASSMEELTSTVKQNADNAQQANVLAQSATAIAIKGGDVVAQVVSTMGAINTSSKRIVDIISVIDGIAFQTNILALNAAVEAARAGEQGRGFAVVATEVRSLAQRSAAAAREIKTLIDHSVSNVETGSALVTQAGSTMQQVVTSIQRVTDIMGEITAASSEQSAGIAQVNQAIAQMDTVTQQNAALVEEEAAATASLNNMAANLARVVSGFKLEINASSTVSHFEENKAPLIRLT